ncbi:hypothetical protein ACW95P_00540 [Candidatus Mycoplasma pogonae]
MVVSLSWLFLNIYNVFIYVKLLNLPVKKFFISILPFGFYYFKKEINIIEKNRNHDSVQLGFKAKLWCALYSAFLGSLITTPIAMSFITGANFASGTEIEKEISGALFGLSLAWQIINGMGLVVLFGAIVLISLGFLFRDIYINDKKYRVMKFFFPQFTYLKLYAENSLYKKAVN